MGMVREFRTHPNPELTTCPRRTLWTKDDPLPWPLIVSNIILDALANFTYNTDLKHEFWVDDTGDLLVAFRAGTWKDHWKDPLIYEASRLGRRGVILLWENKGKLAEVELPVPESVPEPERVGDPPRIRKDLPVGTICWYCPVRQKCTAWDEVHGTVEDWPEGWTK